MKHYAFKPIAFLGFVCLCVSNQAEAQVLARLSFLISPQKMAAFEAAYPTQIEPILKQHGLVTSPLAGRATPDSIYSSLFALPRPVDILRKRRALQQDTRFKNTLKNLGVKVFRNSFSSDTFDFLFEAYSIPDKFGRTVSAGFGTTQMAGSGKGLWHTYSEPDGLVGVALYATYQDQNGYLWFAAQKGVSRYDGSTWTTFRTQVGRGYNRVRAIAEDNRGHLWFGTQGGGVSRYDPLAKSEQNAWATFTTEEGLTNNNVHTIAQGPMGHLWFGTFGGGVSRYDPLAKSEQNAWTTFTTKDGLAHNHVDKIIKDSKGHLWFGTRGGISQYDGSKFRTWKTKDGLTHNHVLAIAEDDKGHLWLGTQNGVSHYNGTVFTTLSTQDGLVDHFVHAILPDSDGYLWFGTPNGVSRYHPKSDHKQNAWTTFQKKDGLIHNNVRSIVEDRDGHFWFGTQGGASRYDSSDWTTFNTTEGLANDWVDGIAQDRKGHFWFGTLGGGVSRYDGQMFTTFTKKDGLVNNDVRFIVEDRKGNLWFATFGGVSRYDGKTFTRFTAQNGLANNNVRSILEDRKGHLWFATRGGVSRYDGATFTTYSQADGLGNNRVTSVFEDREGHIWFGTLGGGVNRYDGQNFTAFVIGEQTEGWLQGGVVYFITQDPKGNLLFSGEGQLCQYDPSADPSMRSRQGSGQAAWTLFDREKTIKGSTIRAGFRDHKGHIWFGTTGGVSRYDGQTFQTLINHDGLAGNLIYSVFQDRNNNYWFGTQSGVTHYRPPPETLPPISIDAVIADQRHTKPKSIQFSSTVPIVSLEFHGVSFKTRPEAMVYRYRLQGYEQNWNTTHKRRVEYAALKTGSYTFEVQAVDRDLTYSKSATVMLKVVPPFYLQTRFLIPTGTASVLILGTLIFQAIALVRRKREVSRYRQAAVAELSDAREVQLSLLPKSAPHIAGLDVAGICEPATEVGGDYFTYCQLNGTSKNLGIVLMDVTGHGMKAATTALLANGMLQSELRNQQSPDQVLTQMDRSLKEMLPKRSFVAAAFAHLNLKDRTLTHYNAGLPEPILWRNGQSIPIAVHSTIPLGGPFKPRFAGTTITLQPRDTVFLFSDGLTEATNEEGAMYSERRLTEYLMTLEDIETDTQAWITAIQQDVQAFVGNGELEDDLTIVGIRVL